MVIHKATLTFEYADEILRCDHSNESTPLLSHGATFQNILQNEIWKSGCNLPLAALFTDWISFHLVHLLPLVLTSNYS